MLEAQKAEAKMSKTPVYLNPQGFKSQKEYCIKTTPLQQNVRQEVSNNTRKD